ncbi:MAG: SUMF1/EgtB/PvdO family nonheme iron enzyme [Planctomycetota bacterium]|nr:SUMF1/EgtB/PvdO family nonheme iron enzyme [Planctomycetota bacterium]
MRPFLQEDAYRFFGRDEQTSRMLERLEDNRFLAVVGASGCGKSSLVYAGLLPALDDGWLNGALPTWKMVTLRPGDAPLQNLAAALDDKLRPSGPVDPLAVSVLRNTLSQGRYGLVQAVADAKLDGRTNVLIFVDQFEELFRFGDWGQRERQAAGPVQTRSDRRNESAAFVKLLLEAVEQKQQPIYVLLSMRSDFLGNCDLFQGLPEAISESQFLTPRMTRDQLREAIVEPLQLFNARPESGLTDRILNDVGTEHDQLPLMQHALMRTWDVAVERCAKTNETPIVVRQTDYLDPPVLGVAQALNIHADEVYQGLADVSDRAHTANVTPTSQMPSALEMADWFLGRFQTSTAQVTRNLETRLASASAVVRRVQSNQPPPGTTAPGKSLAVPSVDADEPAGPRREPSIQNSIPSPSSGATSPRELMDRVTASVLRPIVRGLNRLQAIPEPPPSRRQWLCERLFRSLSETTSSNQVIRRPAKIAQIAAEADRAVDDSDPLLAKKALERVIAEVVEVAWPFLVPECSLLNASPKAETKESLTGETTLDISHEALLRQWKRCSQWVEAEAEGTAVWRRVVDQIESARVGKGGYFGHDDLKPIEEWEERQQPTAKWAARHSPTNRTHISFRQTQTFLRDCRFRLRVLAFFVLACAIGLVAGGWWLVYREGERKQEVSWKVTKLLSAADPRQIAPLLEELKEKPTTWHQKLWDSFQPTASGGSESETTGRQIERRNAALALLHLQPSGKSLDEPVQYLVDQILESSPTEIGLLREALVPYAQLAEPPLWAAMKDTTNRPRRLRAAAALAGIPAPVEPPTIQTLSENAIAEWKSQGTDIARELLSVSPLELKAWTDILRPRREFLEAELAATYRMNRSDQRRPQREAAALVLAESWDDQPEKIIAGLSDADSPAEFQPFAAVLQRRLDEQRIHLLVTAAGGPHFAEKAPAKPNEQRIATDWKTLWRPNLNAAACLVRLGRIERITRLLPAEKEVVVGETLRDSPDAPQVPVENEPAKKPTKVRISDPTFQSYLLVRIQELDAIGDANDLSQFWDEKPTSEPEIQQFMLLALGDFDSLRLPDSTRKRILNGLAGVYRNSPDSGVRAAAGWTWGEWQRQRPETEIDDIRQGDQPKTSVGNWVVNTQGQTFAIFRDNKPYVREERNFETDEAKSLPMPAISYSFTIATHEVTVEQWLRFVAESAQKKFPTTLRERDPGLKEFTSNDNCPVNGISWYNAAAYCNWLSDLEGLEPCYQPNPQSKKYEEGMSIVANFREKSGYRLPTEEEWEYACRAGSTTQFAFGEPADARLVNQYAWWVENAAGTTHAIGTVRPNRFGLFDMHGNLWEWTNSRFENPSTDTDNRILGNQSRVLRGGGFNDFGARDLGSSDRNPEPPDDPNDSFGFRPSRTYP